MRCRRKHLCVDISRPVVGFNKHHPRLHITGPGAPKELSPFSGKIHGLKSAASSKGKMLTPCETFFGIEPGGKTELSCFRGGVPS